MDESKPAGIDSVAVAAGCERTAEGEQCEPIYLTSSFRFADAEQAAARFAEEEKGNIYSRFTNPTVRMFENRLAAMEGTEDCIATSTGMSAILTAVLGICSAGGRVVAARRMFGATLNLLTSFIAKFGVDVVYVKGADAEAWRFAARGRAELMILESPTNPQLEVCDISAISTVARETGALLLVDNCLCTPVLQHPAELGADLVMHSCTKYIDGQGRVLGGALCGSAELVRGRLFPFLRCGGPALSPFNAWILAKGLETLPLRIRAQSQAAAGLAAWLEGRDEVERVHYPFTEDSVRGRLARAQQSAGGGIVPVVVRGGRSAAWRFINALRLFSITANFGDAKSTVTHPASTTHSRLEPEERAEIGISESLVRLSVGLEDPRDLQKDIERALRAVA